MVQPNYNFAKRQRELAKKAKKEQKLQRKNAAAGGEDSDATPAEGDALETPEATKPAEA